MPMVTHTVNELHFFRDRVPASQVPQEQRFTIIFTTFWVSSRCFDLRFSEHHKINNQNTAWQMFVLGFLRRGNSDDCLYKQRFVAYLMFYAQSTSTGQIRTKENVAYCYHN